MGLRYLLFRVFHELKIRTSLLKIIIPGNPNKIDLPDLEQWRKNNKVKFFFNSKDDLKPYSDLSISNKLRLKIDDMKKGQFLLFYSTWFNLGKDYDWITNPETGFQYDISKHWSEILDYSKEAGDIKYVWEKARFGFLYDIIRFDLHSGIDQSKWVFNEIEDFINKNPINMGPNYKCSQEISLRILNWTFALHYYRNSKYLTEELYFNILNSIYWQYHHIYHNINFSRIAVRNNHAITETLTLYIIGLLFPFFPNAKKWKLKGKKFFEREIDYQLFNNGGFLQFSHNYHRVVIQLLTWGIHLAGLNKERFSETVYDRAGKSLELLLSVQDKDSGWLPNYGPNDGALFFSLNNEAFRNFKPQLQALSIVLGNSLYSSKFEDVIWYRLTTDNLKSTKKRETKLRDISKFQKAGIFVLNDSNTKTIINATDFKTRPTQADGLNIDIWVRGNNIIRDPGTFKYNTENKYLKFYFGSEGHNTLTLGDNDQMIKGNRFIWYYWTKAVNRRTKETELTLEFEGEISCFRELGKNIIHKRKVIVYKNQLRWSIIDHINYSGKFPKVLHWNIHPSFSNIVDFKCMDSHGNSIPEKDKKGWYSEVYGVREDVLQKTFTTWSNKIETSIEITGKL